jgi:hypothetical protein
MSDDIRKVVEEGYDIGDYAGALRASDDLDSTAAHFLGSRIYFLPKVGCSHRRVVEVQTRQMLEACERDFALLGAGDTDVWSATGIRQSWFELTRLSQLVQVIALDASVSKSDQQDTTSI